MRSLSLTRLIGTEHVLSLPEASLFYHAGKSLAREDRASEASLQGRLELNAWNSDASCEKISEIKELTKQI